MSDMASIVDGLKKHKHPFPEQLHTAWKTFGIPHMHDKLEELPKTKNKRIPPCWEVGICICGENKVLVQSTK